MPLRPTVQGDPKEPEGPGMDECRRNTSLPCPSPQKQSYSAHSTFRSQLSVFSWGILRIDMESRVVVATCVPGQVCSFSMNVTATIIVVRVKGGPRSAFGSPHQ